MAGELTTGDLALMRDGGSLGGNGLLYFIGIVILFGIMGGGFFGGGNRGDYVTNSEFYAGLNNQAVQNSIQQTMLSSANNNYETARLIQNQTAELVQQNNTNLINAIQGFNTLSSQIQNLGAQLNDCCCSIKTQMLQDRLADRDRQLVVAQNAIDNANQTQVILGNLGRFVAWTPSGTNGAVAAGT